MRISYYPGFKLTEKRMPGSVIQGLISRDSGLHRTCFTGGTIPNKNTGYIVTFGNLLIFHASYL